MISELESLIRVPYFDTYLHHVKYVELERELHDSQQAFDAMLQGLTEDQLTLRYAPEKWTIAQVVYHVIETELIFNFRALTFAKEDGANLPGFDENSYTAAAQLEDATVDSLSRFFNSTRESTLGLLQTLNSEQLQRVGQANDNQAQVAAMFYITSGHARHHMLVIQERYLGE